MKAPSLFYSLSAIHFGVRSDTPCFPGTVPGTPHEAGFLFVRLTRGVFVDHPWYVHRNLFVLRLACHSPSHDTVLGASLYLIARGQRAEREACIRAFRISARVPRLHRIAPPPPSVSGEGVVRMTWVSARDANKTRIQNCLARSGAPMENTFLFHMRNGEVLIAKLGTNQRKGGKLLMDVRINHACQKME